MIDIKSDLNIFYCGGSGGFILLHLLLLQRRFLVIFSDYLDYNWYCNWIQNQLNDIDFLHYVDQHIELLPEDVPENPADIFQHKLNSLTRYEYYLQVTADLFPSKIVNEMLDHIITQQWNPQRSTWKHGEIWPDNNQTQKFPAPPDFNKIYFTCNNINDWQRLPGHKIIMYTDMRTQIRMSWFKKVGGFLGIDKSLMSQRKLLRKLLKNPLISDVQQIWNQADTHIKLQDLINDPRWVGPELQLINEWKKQHPENLLKKVGINV